MKRSYLRPSAYRLLAVLFGWLLMTGTLPAQRWRMDYNMGSGNDEGMNLMQTQDGGYIVSGIGSQGFLMKTDANGQEQWRYNFGGGYGMRLAITPEQNYVTVVQGAATYSLSKIDASGNLMWNKPYTIPGVDLSFLQDIELLPDSGFFICGGLYRNPNYTTYLVRTNSAGDTLWTREYNFGCLDAISIAEGSGGNHFLLLQYAVSNSQIKEIDAAGNVVSTRTLSGRSQFSSASAFIPTSTGYIAATTISGGVSYIAIDNMDASCNIIWSDTIIKPQSYYVHGICEAPGGGYVLTGFLSDIPPYKLFITKINSTGQELWTRNYGVNQMLEGADIIPSSFGGYVITGSSGPANNNRNHLLIHVDDEGQLFSNYVRGNVYYDINEDCVHGVGEPGKRNRLITLGNSYGYQSITSDTLGNYSFFADTGTYTLSISPGFYYWGHPSCSVDTLSLTLTQPTTAAYDTTTVDFPRKALVQCPLMDVDISTALLRRCMNNVYTVNYCNVGTQDAANVTVDVTLDSMMTLISSTLPVAAQNGDTYTFNIGSVPSDECGSFQLTVYLSCAAVLGQNHCVDAQIYPDSSCLPPNPNWDLSSITVEGECIPGDSVQFKIRNNGTGNTSTPHNYYITEENIMLFMNPFTLPAGDSLVVTLAAQGQLFRMEATQSPFHPWNDAPVAVTVEGCGTNGMGSFTIGLFNNLPEYDYAPSYSLDCQANIGSYDPNDKRGTPFGYDAPHYITKDDRIEYKIRFQNTGTDTAFNIVIRDTLSSFLDPGTVISGASSDPYTFRIYGNNILEWTFANIMLPDSNVNEPASHGFVKFMVSQTPNNPNGTVINNSAAIYFDFNEPVITNTTFHTIGENFIVLDVKENNPVMPTLHAFPNPMHFSTTIQVTGISGALRYELCDLSGRVLHQEQLSQTQVFTLQRGNLPAGLYLLRLYSGDRIAGTARLIVD